MASLASHWLLPRRTIGLILIAATILLLLLYLGQTPSGKPLREVSSLWDAETTGEEPEPENPSVAIVVPRQKHENTTWLEQSFPDWTKYIYEVDNRRAPLTVPTKKGREAMTYLTYIIDHYDQLHDVTIFHHADRYQWHTDDPDYDSLRLLTRLNLTHVQERGYQNLRCAWKPGCYPDALYLLPKEAYRRRSLNARDDSNPGDGPLSLPEPTLASTPDTTLAEAHPPVTIPAADPTIEAIMKQNAYQAFVDLFDDLNIPELVQSPSSAEFAVSSNTIRRREKDEYVHYLRWIKKPQVDDITTRLLERFWHVIFSKPNIDCPRAQACYCSLYGLCDLECGSEGSCSAQWHPPESELDSPAG